MGLNSKNKIIDFYNGKQDIEDKIIRTVGNPYERFSEDYLRIIRACRFAAKLNFIIDKGTFKAGRKLRRNILYLSKERIKNEFMKAAISGPILSRFIKNLDKMRILSLIIPELISMKGMTQRRDYHPEGDVYDHTHAALNISESNDPIVNLGILFHDIGKCVAFGRSIHGTTSYYGHDTLGGNIINNISKRIKFSNEEQEILHFIVINHMKIGKINKMKKSKIYKYVIHPYFDKIIHVVRVDNACRGDIALSKEKHLEIINKALQLKDTYFEKKEKLVDGNVVMQLTGLTPSKNVGLIINKVSDWIIDNEINDTKLINKKIMETYEKLNEI